MFLIIEVWDLIQAVDELFLTFFHLLGSNHFDEDHYNYVLSFNAKTSFNYICLIFTLLALQIYIKFNNTTDHMGSIY